MCLSSHASEAQRSGEGGVGASRRRSPATEGAGTGETAPSVTFALLGATSPASPKGSHVGVDGP